MHVSVDQDLCIGCGICANICSGCFEMADDFKSHVIEGCSCEAEGCCQQAADACPVQAIEVTE